MKSTATTVAQYLAEVPADRRATLETVRAVIRAAIDRDVEEGMQYGMIGYYVPHRVFPAGYHTNPAEPLPYICLASQKNNCALYLMHVYRAPEEQLVREGFKRAGKKLDMGKTCIRFKRAEDLALDVLAEVIRRVPSGEWVRRYAAARAEAAPRARRGPASDVGVKATSRKRPTSAAKPARRRAAKKK